MPTHYLYLPKSQFDVGDVATIHRVFADEDNTFTATCIDAGGSKVYCVFSAGYNGDGGGTYTVEVLVGISYESAVYNGSNIWEWTAPAVDDHGFLGSCADCTCVPEACDRRATAVKRWIGWFRWDATPLSAYYTTRYRKNTITFTYTVGPEAFAGSGDYTYIDSTYTPSGTDVFFGNTPACDASGASATVSLYNTSGGAPANYTYWPGGTFTRVTVNEYAQHEAVAWEYNYVTITEEGDVVYTYSREHLNGFYACEDCPAASEATDPNWATIPPQLPGYDYGPCNNFLKYILDNQIGMDLDSTTISPDGLTKTESYSGTFAGVGTSTVSATIVSVLSEPYTLADCMTDADALLAQVPTDGSIKFDTKCAGTAIVMGCFGWPVAGATPRTNDIVIFEDAVCSVPQDYSVGYMSSDMGSPLDDDVAAQRMLYDGGGIEAYCIVTRSWWVWGVGHSRTTLLTTAYTKPTNDTESVSGTSSTTPTAGVVQIMAPASYPSLEIQTLEP